MKKAQLLSTIALCLTTLSIPLSAQTEFELKSAPGPGRVITMENEFIKLIVNNDKEDYGRFALETTGGDLENNFDNNKSLIYGKPVPWTSYTTVLVNGSPIVFGPPSSKLMRRVGDKIQFGKILTQDQEKGLITTVGQNGPIEVIQKLSFATNPSTKFKDNLLIEYILTNHSSEAKDVGVRILLDTKLGDNDAAPFRIGKEAITSEKQFAGKYVLDYWQTFDSTDSGSIVAQGTLRSKDLGLTPPNRIALVNWGTLVDNPWEFPYKENRSFIREGESEKDTSLALYFDEKKLNPGESRIIRTLYGLGGLTLSEGDLKLGLTAPTDINLSSKEQFMVIGYIVNATKYAIQNVEAEFVLPEGLKVVQGNLKETIDRIEPKQTEQVVLKLIPTEEASPGPNTIELKVQSSNLEGNSVKRKINFTAIAEIEATLEFPPKKIIGFDAYVDAILTLKNPATYSISNIKTELNTNNLILPEFEPAIKTIKELGPSEEVKINWKIKTKDEASPKETIKVSISAKGMTPQILSRNIIIKKPSTLIKFKTDKKNIDPKESFYVELGIENPPLIQNKQYEVLFDPGQVALLRVSTAANLKEVTINDEGKDGKVTLSNINYNKDPKPYLMIGKFHFVGIEPGKVAIGVYENGLLESTEKINIKGE